MSAVHAASAAVASAGSPASGILMRMAHGVGSGTRRFQLR